METRQIGGKTFDYLGEYERAVVQVTAACGSKENANKMLDEIYRNYETTDVQLKRLEKEFGKGSEKFETEKAFLLGNANQRVHASIEKYAPQTKEHVKEIIIGISLAASAVLMPAIYPASLLLTASGIVAMGGSYIISLNLIRKLKVLSGKAKLADMVGTMKPKQVKLGGLMKKK